MLCSIAGISRSSYYRYKNTPLKDETDLEEKILKLYNKTNKRAGYRFIKKLLKTEYKLIVNHKKTYRIMKALNIKSIVRKKKKKTTAKTEVVKENILNRNFTSAKPGKKFVTDITYIPTRTKMMYLCVIIDLFNNEPVAWNISSSQDKYLSINTIKSLAKKYDLRDAIIHSDRGVHYTNKEYVVLLSKLGVQQSMSRKGNCWDNAPAESFFSHYKCESIYLMKKKIKGPADVVNITNEYMDYYINYRPQKKLGGVPPKMFKTA